MRYLFLGIEPAVMAHALECRIGTVNVHLRNCATKAGVPNRVLAPVIVRGELHNRATLPDREYTSGHPAFALNGSWFIGSHLLLPLVSSCAYGGR